MEGDEDVPKASIASGMVLKAGCLVEVEVEVPFGWSCCWEGAIASIWSLGKGCWTAGVVGVVRGDPQCRGKASKRDSFLSSACVCRVEGPISPDKQASNVGCVSRALSQ